MRPPLAGDATPSDWDCQYGGVSACRQDWVGGEAPDDRTALWVAAGPPVSHGPLKPWSDEAVLVKEGRRRHVRRQRLLRIIPSVNPQRLLPMTEPSAHDAPTPAVSCAVSEIPCQSFVMVWVLGDPARGSPDRNSETPSSSWPSLSFCNRATGLWQAVRSGRGPTVL
jgi:hypothetical protein